MVVVITFEVSVLYNIALQSLSKKVVNIMNEFDKAVDDIYNAIGGKKSKDEIRKELEEWLKKRVSLAEARRSIIYNYGGNLYTVTGDFVKVEDLATGMGRVNLVAKIVSINQKNYEIDGTVKMMRYGLLGDETGTIPFTAWSMPIDLKKGDTVEIRNAYTREWQGQVKLIIGQKTQLKLLPNTDIAVKANVKQAKIADLHPHMGLVEVVGKVLSVERREVTVDDLPRTIYSGIIADDSGEIQFTSWDTEVKEGDVLRISGAYVSTYRGMAQLVFDARSTISKEALTINIKSTPVPLDSLEGRGGVNVLVEGVIIDIKDGSGLIYRCPECGRVLNGTSCPVHGRVTPKADLRIKAVLDDGTGAAQCLFNREQTEQLLGLTLSEAIEKIKENMGNPSIIYDMMEEKLFARPMRIRGNAMSDEKYGLRILVKDFEMLDLENISKKAENMLEELGW